MRECVCNQFGAQISNIFIAQETICVGLIQRSVNTSSYLRLRKWLFLCIIAAAIEAHPSLVIEIPMRLCVESLARATHTSKLQYDCLCALAPWINEQRQRYQSRHFRSCISGELVPLIAVLKKTKLSLLQRVQFV